MCGPCRTRCDTLRDPCVDLRGLHSIGSRIRLGTCRYKGMQLACVAGVPLGHLGAPQQGAFVPTMTMVGTDTEGQRGLQGTRQGADDRAGDRGARAGACRHPEG
jgi:hypothetical protein